MSYGRFRDFSDFHCIRVLIHANSVPKPMDQSRRHEPIRHCHRVEAPINAPKAWRK
jgi:hypothetical protein